MSAPLRIGTRGSPLALWQARAVRDALLAAHGAAALNGTPELVVIKTTGDQIADRPLRDFGGKGLFTKEIEEALVSGAIDLAVHSAKDMPTLARPELAIAACLPRADVADVLISRAGGPVSALPAGAVVGTASLRRQAQLRRVRPDLQVTDIRGNVETRLAKIASGHCDAVVLARAGLTRLGLAPAGAHILTSAEMVPAAGQGAVAMEVRVDDQRTTAFLAAIDHDETRRAVLAERACLALLNGSCRSPIAAHAQFAGARVEVVGLALSSDGREAYEAVRAGAAEDAEEVARAVARSIRTAAPEAFRAAYLAGE